MKTAFLVLASLFSGAIGGMGIGGGIVLIPVLTSFFEMTQKKAQYINLIYFVPVAICALWIHMRSGRVAWRKALFMALGGVLGAFFGSELTRILDGSLLKRFFGIFLFAVGIKQLRKPKKNKRNLEE